MLTISASDIRTYQTCRRKWLLNRSWNVLRWPPKRLFDSCLRQGIMAISSGTDSSGAALVDARTRFLTEAARPGLDLLAGDPWTVANDWAGMLATVLSAIRRLTLLQLIRPTPVPLDGHAWSSSSFADESGALHRWITVDNWNADALARELHSWPVIGDMVMYDSPMTLHVIEVGRMRDGRRISPWARAWKHPIIAGEWRFQRPDGKGGWRKLAGEKWTPVWYADQVKPDPAQWVDLMDSDGVTPALLHHLSIAQPSQKAASRCRAEILEVVGEIDRLSLDHPGPADGALVPMARGACDPVTGPCPWQTACYRENPGEDIGGLGLYQIRAVGGDERSSRPRSSPLVGASI